MEYQNIDISTWTQVGEGGNGKTYVHPDHPDILLKVNKPPFCEESYVKQELDAAEHVFELGIPSPRMYDIVRVGNGFGQLVELVKGKKSLSRICADDPSCIGEAASLLAEQGKRLHTTPCNTEFFPNAKELALNGLEKSDFVSDEDRNKIKKFIQSLGDETTCVHGDFQMGNLVVSGDGKPYWIDLGRFCYGSSMFDMGHLFILCFVYSKFPQALDLVHMSEDQLHIFWDKFATAYTGDADHAAFDALAGKFAPLDICIRTIWAPPSEALKNLFTNLIHSLVEKFY